MAKLRIDASELVDAMTTSRDFGHEFYLDLTTGKVLRWEDPKQYEKCSWADDLVPELKEIRKAVDSNPENFLEIDRISSREGFEIMERFAENLPDSQERARTDLIRALGRKGPFRQFKDMLGYYPDVRDQYFEHMDLSHEKLAAQWLKDNDIEFEFFNTTAERLANFKKLQQEEAAKPKKQKAKK